MASSDVAAAAGWLVQERDGEGADLALGTTQARYTFASLVALSGNRPRAIALFRALLSDPAGAALRAGCCFHLGKLALLTGRSDDARTLLKSCLAASPNHAAAAGLLRGLENATQDACLPS